MVNREMLQMHHSADITNASQNTGIPTALVTVS